MVKVGDVLRLPVATESVNDGTRRMITRYENGVCIFVHPKGRFATFDFGWQRESFSMNDLKSMGH